MKFMKMGQTLWGERGRKILMYIDLCVFHKKNLHKRLTWLTNGKKYFFLST